ncbi:transcription factor Bye1p [[Candida] jaroonii]|uniref:Transcription factor Bye1p n=1 Tax=[Candida] jaroonii TaxID=467808 RepID=A0ACA9Y475_9ASCO|nr:transcription factor Bye1p [[Candida] jaroonii]
MIRRSSRANKGRHSQRDAELEQAFKDEIENYISDDDRPSKMLKLDNDGEYGGDEVSDLEIDFNGSDVEEEELDVNEDSGSVKCICGANDSNYEDFNEKYGEEMICCDKCNTWQHNSCMKIGRVPKSYMCNDCANSARTSTKIATKPTKITKSTVTKSMAIRPTATKPTATKTTNTDFPEFKDSSKISIARIFQTTVTTKLPKDSDPEIAHNWAVRLTNAVYTDSNPQQKARAVLPLLKNNDVLNKMISNSITPEQLISLRPQDVVKGLNEIAEKVRLESLKRSVLKVDEAPRVRRTHKGEEVVEDVSDQHKAEMEVNIVSRSVDHRVFEDKKKVHKQEVHKQEVTKEKENTYNFNTAMLDDDSEDEKDSFTKDSSTGLDDDDDLDKILGHKTPPATAPSTPGPKSILKSPSTKPNATKSILKTSTNTSSSTNIESCDIWKGRLTFPDFTSFTASAKFITATGYQNPTSESAIKFHNHCINTSKQIFTRSFYDIQGKLDRSRADPYLTTVKSSKDFFVFEVTNEDNQDDYNKLFGYLLTKNRVGVLSGKPAFAKDAYLFALKDSVPSYFRDLVNLNGRQGLYAVYVLKKNDRPSVSAPVRASVEVANPLSSILSALSTPAVPSAVVQPPAEDKLAHMNLPADLTPQQRTAIVNLLEANPHLEGNPEQILDIVRQG